MSTEIMCQISSVPFGNTFGKATFGNAAFGKPFGDVPSRNVVPRLDFLPRRFTCSDVVKHCEKAVAQN